MNRRPGLVTRALRTVVLALVGALLIGGTAAPVTAQVGDPPPAPQGFRPRPLVPEGDPIDPDDPRLQPVLRGLDAGDDAVQPFAASTTCYDATIRSAHNGRYVSTELNYTGARQNMLRARSATSGPWTKYILCVITDSGSYSHHFLYSVAAGRSVSAELGYGGNQYGMLRARASSIGSWECFDIYSVLDGNVWRETIRSQANGRLAAAEFGAAGTGSDNGVLRARSNAQGPWELFIITT